MSDLFCYVNKKKQVEDFQCKHKVPVNKKKQDKCKDFQQKWRVQEL